MGLREFAGKLVSATVQAPRFFGIVSIFQQRSPRGPSLIDDIKNADIEGFLYDGREVLGGIDMHGVFRPEWIKRTWTPVIFGDLATRGLQFIRSVLADVL